MGTLATTKSQVHQEITQVFGLVPEWVQKVPDSALTGLWGQFRDFYLSDQTKIPQKYKELIGLGVSAATRCRYCTLFHTEAARLAGATDDEIAEANAMAAVTMSASTFLNGMQIDYERFRKETSQIVEFVKQHQVPAAAAGPRPHASV